MRWVLGLDPKIVLEMLVSVAGGVDFGIDVVLRTEAGERVVQLSEIYSGLS